MELISNLLLMCLLISLITVILAGPESATKDDGTVVYKFIDVDGMAWEYELKVMQTNGSAEPIKVKVFRGPWIVKQPQSESSCQQRSQLSLTVMALSLGALTIVNSSL
ncbi:hypothetical protein KR093_011059 [Drosophila rubida]|uniref:Uncharacterized protein n=1 Tax=Drosophila rubida TaxID=30044 RepID=A0AAD4PLP8_9MUSC|nr:hypothetical protein KR093_011059 [Drosophila rubida]